MLASSLHRCVVMCSGVVAAIGTVGGERGSRGCQILRAAARFLRALGITMLALVSCLGTVVVLALIIGFFAGDGYR